MYSVVGCIISRAVYNIYIASIPGRIHAGIIIKDVHNRKRP